MGCGKRGVSPHRARSAKPSRRFPVRNKVRPSFTGLPTFSKFFGICFQAYGIRSHPKEKSSQNDCSPYAV